MNRRNCDYEGCTNLARKRGRKCSRHSQSPETFAARKLRGKGAAYRLHKKDHCENPECLWIGPLLAYQLQVDHIDGDHFNNDPDNLITLCANCHARKTWDNQEYHRPDKRGKNVVVDV